MLQNTEDFANVLFIPLNWPNSPEQIGHTHELQDFFLQLWVLIRVLLAYLFQLFLSIDLDDGETRVGEGAVVQGSLVDEVGDVVGEVVEWRIVVINEENIVRSHQDVEVVEVIVADFYSVLTLRK